jgi:hypothetical protein
VQLEELTSEECLMLANTYSAFSKYENTIRCVEVGMQKDKYGKNQESFEDLRVTARCNLKPKEALKDLLSNSVINQLHDNSVQRHAYIFALWRYFEEALKKKILLKLK